MSTSGPGPRRVGPPPPPPRPPWQPGDEGAGTGGPEGHQAGDRPPSWRGPETGPWVRTWAWGRREGSVPWFAVLLLVLGVGLLIELLIPELTFGSLVILATGGALAAAWLVGRVVGATVPALVLIGWGLAGVGSDLGYLPGDGWGALFIGIAFLVGWGLGRFQDSGRRWALVLGLILGVIGLADVSDNLPFDVDVAVLIPLTMIAIGIYLIVRGRWPAISGG